MLLLLLIPPGRNKGKPNFFRFQGNISQELIEAVLPETVFDFTVDRKCKNTAS